MIGRLNGTLLEKTPPLVLIDCNGVGYECEVPMSTFYNLPAVGEKVVMLTHFVVREDAQLLYGFYAKRDRALFRELIRLNGVGPKLALALMSGMSVDELIQCVNAEDTSRLMKVPGVGKKTADRVVVDLSDKVGLAVTVAHASGAITTPAGDEALEALMALGFTLHDAMQALEHVPKDLPTGERVTQALRTQS